MRTGVCSGVVCTRQKKKPLAAANGPSLHRRLANLSVMHVATTPRTGSGRNLTTPTAAAAAATPRGQDKGKGKRGKKGKGKEGDGDGGEAEEEAVPAMPPQPPIEQPVAAPSPLRPKGQAFFDHDEAVRAAACSAAVTCVTRWCATLDVRGDVRRYRVLAGRAAHVPGAVGPPRVHGRPSRSATLALRCRSTAATRR